MGPMRPICWAVEGLILWLMFPVSSFAQNIPLSTDFRAPITVPLLEGMRSGSSSLQLDDPTLPGQNVGATEPYQIHLAPAGQSSMYIMWATGNYSVFQGPPPSIDLNQTTSVVRYGLTPDGLNLTASGLVETYNQIYNTSAGPKGGATAQNYTSPFLHTTILDNLRPGTRYFYQVGDGSTFSATFNFTSLIAPGPSYPQRLILIADMGASQNSTVTMAHALQSVAESGHGTAPLVNYIGDYTYADTWSSNGTASVPQTSFYGLTPSTFQPVWDMWQKLVQPLVAQVPLLGCVGNHEIEQQEDVNYTTFASVRARWKVPSAPSKSGSYFYYSFELGPVHNIFLANYADYVPGSDQWNWLYKDLLSVNRTNTPWVIVNFHNPWVTTDTSWKEFEAMRLSLEPLLYQAGVDIVFNGHVHAYERSFPVYNYQLDACSMTHVTIGDAGNAAGLSFLASPNNPATKTMDTGGGCGNATTPRLAYFVSANPSVNDQFSFYKRAYTFQANGNSTGVGQPMGFCYSQQPMWSAYREPSFGHGTLDILNGTHALWLWRRNQDNNMVAADSVYIIRDTARCANKMYPMRRSTDGGLLAASS